MRVHREAGIHPSGSGPRVPAPRRGQVLVEFAMIALVLYLIMAAILDLGRALFGAQVLQLAADLAAKELARLPLPPNVTFDQALYDRADTYGVRARIFDDRMLVFPLDEDGNIDGQSQDDVLAGLPVVNQQLWPLMIIEDVGGRRVRRYPGALLSDDTVAIPVVVGRAADGTETIDWVRVVEEIRPAGGSSRFPLALPDDDRPAWQRGLVALRINYPFQGAALSGYAPRPAPPFEPPNVSEPILANDAGVAVIDRDGYSPEGSPVEDDRPAGTYAGPYGLGRHLAQGQAVRPFRRLLSAQAIARREVFGP